MEEGNKVRVTFPTTCRILVSFTIPSAMVDHIVKKCPVLKVENFGKWEDHVEGKAEFREKEEETAKG